MSDEQIPVTSGTEINTQPSISKPMPKKYIAIIVIVVLIGASFWGYEWYQTKRYVERIFAFYGSWEVLDKDLANATYNSVGKRFVDIFDEYKRIKQAGKDMKMKIAEINPPTSKAKEMRGVFMNVLDTYSELVDAGVSITQAQMNFQSAEKLLQNYENDYYVSRYSSNMIKEQQKKLEEAKAERKKSGEKLIQLTAKYDLDKVVLKQLVGSN
jgi:ribosomal protein S24E